MLTLICLLILSSFHSAQGVSYMLMGCGDATPTDGMRQQPQLEPKAMHHVDIAPQVYACVPLVKSRVVPLWLGGGTTCCLTALRNSPFTTSSSRHMC